MEKTNALLILMTIIGLLTGVIYLLYFAGNKATSANMLKRRVFLTIMVLTLGVIIAIGATSYTSSQRRVTLQELQKLTNELGDASRKTSQETISSEGFQKDHIGFAFYGIRNHDGTWAERHFKVEYNPIALPSVGDKIESVANVNVRSGYVEYIEGEGWKNKKVIGSIKPYEVFRVIDVNSLGDSLGDSYVWIKFKKE